MLDECLPADPRALTGYTHTLMAQLCLDGGLPAELCFRHLEKTTRSSSLPAWLQFRRGVLYREADEPERALRIFHRLADSGFDEAELQYQQALCWMELGEWGKALHCATVAHSLRDEEDFVELMGEALLELGHSKDALELFDVALDGLDRHHARIYAFERKGQFKDAIDEVDEALSYFPREAALLAKRAQLKVDQGDLEGARWDYSTAIAMQRRPEFLAGRALLCLDLGRVAEAAADAELAVALDPNEGEALRALAAVLDAQDKLEGAATFWGRYTGATGDLQGLLFQAEVWNRAGAIERADALLEQYRRLHPSNWEGAYYKMAFLRTREEYQAAEKLAQSLVRSKPDEYAVLIERARNFLDWGKYETAAEHCVELRRKFPDSLEVQEFWVEILVESSRYELALEAVEQLLQSEAGSDNDILFLKSSILVHLGRWEESLGILNALVSSEPGNADYYEDRAQALYELNRVEESWQDANRGIALDPERAWLRMHRACMNVHRGAFQDTAIEAKELLREDMDYPHRLFCRSLLLGARLSERLKMVFQPLSRLWPGSRTHQTTDS